MSKAVSISCIYQLAFRFDVPLGSGQQFVKSHNIRLVEITSITFEGFIFDSMNALWTAKLIKVSQNDERAWANHVCVFSRLYPTIVYIGEASVDLTTRKMNILLGLSHGSNQFCRRRPGPGPVLGAQQMGLMVLDLSENHGPNPAIGAHERIGSFARPADRKTRNHLLKLLPAPAGQQLSRQTDSEDPGVFFQEALPDCFFLTVEGFSFGSKELRVLKEPPESFNHRSAMSDRYNVTCGHVFLNESCE